MNTNQYKILSDENIIIEYYYGEVTEYTIINMKKDIANNKDYDGSYNSLLDFRDSVFNISKDGMKNLVAFVRDRLIQTPNRKIALLTHTPNHVVVTTIFTNHREDLSMTYQIFSTLQAATAWITNNNDKFSLVANTIDNLRI